MIVVGRRCRSCGIPIVESESTCTLIVCRVVDARVSRVLAKRERQQQQRDRDRLNDSLVRETFIANLREGRT